MTSCRTAFVPVERCVLLAVVAVAIVLPGCNAFVRFVTKDAQPLRYVGAVSLGEVTVEDGQIVVPLAYHGGEWRRNSAIVPHSVDAKVTGEAIELTVQTTVSTGPRKHSHHLLLPAGTAGKYTIYYRDPDGTRHEIGILDLPGAPLPASSSVGL